MISVFSELSDRVSGPVYARGDEGYAAELAGFNTAVVHTPDIVVGVESDMDVVEAVRFAREKGYGVTVQSTGHGANMSVTSGLLLSMKRLDGVSVDAGTRTATIGGGARWGAVVSAAAEFGLAPITGSSGTVGVVGYLLGGGVGPLSRSHGFSSDYLVSLKVVTGMGELVEASADENPDLFWALRGGKGGLGIVTEVRIRLVELTTLYAGSLFFAEEDIEVALRGWVEWTAGADPKVTTSVAIVNLPDRPFIPAPFRGRRLLSIRFAYPGPTEGGMRLAESLRAVAPVYVDALGELPASQIARIHNDPTEPGPSWISGMLLTHVDQEFASALLNQVGKGTNAPFLAAEIRHMGEATRREVAGGSAVGGRPASFALGVVGAPNPMLFESVLPAAVERLRDAVQTWIAAETNINYVGIPRSIEHFRSAWPPETFERLEKVRREYDPDWVFAYGPGGLA